MKFPHFLRTVAVLLPALLLVAAKAGPGSEAAAGGKRFVGSQTCMSCHPKQYERFTQFARKAHSFESVKIMQKNLTDEELKGCYECHTTGYGQPGGFVSEEKTPHMKNNGCEVCHGPGSAHARTLNPEKIIADVDMDTCKTCHNSERVAAFDFKPMKFAGAH
ncbi:MAG TPA: cytochrome c family protein [Desulfosalsimonadaceae bacterium]|nr:cytochrome c family protein [Desulfosalsimonadaceae bacterium]